MKLKELLINSEIVIGEDDLKEKLAAGKRLKIKFGVDPTRPDLTFGHLVVFNKLKQFQDAGHETILIIGDFTARIGDPSGRSELRPELTEKEVDANARTYLEQAFRILDSKKTEIRRNSEWFSKMTFEDSLALTRKMTVARMLERDDFDKRFKSNQPISMVEFMYPLIQGYDSLILESDVEIGGSDQLFNMLVGRNLQKQKGIVGQTVMTLPLLVGLDGLRKMSKSYDNYISFNDQAKDIFGKTMSISDEAMIDYYRLLLLKEEKFIKELKKTHPMEAKMNLAKELTSIFYGNDRAQEEMNSFSKVFSEGKEPIEMPSFSISSLALEVPSLLNLLTRTQLFGSKGEIRRLVQQGAVKLEGEKILNCDYILSTVNEKGMVLRVGKKIFIRIMP